MKTRLAPPLLLLVLGALLLPVADRVTRLARQSSELTSTETSWVRYVMVGLGGFRGVISEVLWIRADRLQQQGRYMELVQLSDWITALDPKATDGWTFNAWNLAYNIPAMLPDHKARLPWVRSGISLLRDKAIPANPSSPKLHRELGWLYQNKIGAHDDAAHLLYKLDLASEFNRDGSRARPSAPGARDALDPALVHEIEERFGAIDWRLAQAHGLYWAYKGLSLHPAGFDEDSLRRMVQQTLIALIFAGKFTGETGNGRYSAEPALHLIPGLEAFFEETVRTHPAEKDVYAIFLARLVRFLAEGHQDQMARDTYRKLETLLRDSDRPPPSYEEVVSGESVERGRSR